MKRRLISILLIVCMLVSILPVEAVFATEPDHENAELQTSERELLPEPAAQPDERENPETGSDLAQEQGKSLKTTVEETASEDPTGPTDPSELEDPPVTRAQWIQMLVQTFSMTVEDNNLPDNYFSDLTGAELYYRDILVAVEFGVIDIAAGGAFEPEGIVTREFAAQTLNYCLGFQLEANPEYTFQEADTVAHPEDLQVGINRGWFSLTDGKVSPALEVTTSEMVLMQADAEAVLVAQNDVGFEENSVTISEGVKEIPLGAVVGTDANGNLTVENCPVKISAGDFFVAYYGELPVAMKALSVSQEDKITVIAFTTDGTEDILSDMQFNGTINVDLRDFVPDSETRTRVVSGQVLTEGPAKRAIKFDEDSMSLEVSKDIKLTNGLKININYELENIDLDYSVDQKTNTSKLVFRGDNDITISVKGDSVPALNDGEEWELGYFPILFGLARIEVVAEFGVSGEISVCIGGRMGIGYTYNKTDGFRIIKEFQKDKFDCTAQVSAKIGVKAKIGFDYLVTRADLYASLGVNGTVKDTRHLDSDTVKDCQDISLYLYAKGGVEAHIFLLPSWKFEGDLWDADTSPLRLHYHMEDGILVDACTMDSSDSDYYTNSSSKYFNPGFNSGSSTYTGNNGETVTLWSYTVNSNGEATITKYNGSAATLTIPAYIDGYPVVAFGSGSNAFANKTSVRSVYISNGITTIGSSAFSGCTNLYSVSIPNSISSIGSSAFQSCTSLTNIEIPGSGVAIGCYAFDYCTSLETVSVPDSAVMTGTYERAPFSGDSVKLVITYDTGSIGNSFMYHLYTTNLSSGNYGGELYGVREIVICEGITSIGESAFRAPNGKIAGIERITIPSSINSIGAYAFSGDGAEAIVFQQRTQPEALTIGSHAFEYCPITSIALPAGTAGLNGYTFYQCGNLCSITLPDSVDTIGAYDFSGCGQLHSVTIPSGCTTIGNFAFYQCYNLAEAVIPNSVISLGNYAFSQCTSLMEASVLGSGVKLYTYCFAGCTSLTTVYIPDSAVISGTYDRAPFEGDSVKLVITYDTGIIPANFMYHLYTTNWSSGNYAGDLFGVHEIVISEGITTISDSAFRAPNGKSPLIERVSFPSTIISIGSYAFAGNGVQHISMPQGDPDISITIASYAFSNCSNLIDVSLPEGITVLNSYTFSECASLEEVVLPSTLTTIGSYVFSNCASLYDFDLVPGISQVDKYAFCGCSSLKSIEITDDMTTISEGCFYGCSSLEHVFVPTTITLINQDAFSGCTGLQTISIANSTFFATPYYSSSYYSFFAGDEVTVIVRAVNNSVSDSWLYNKTSGIKGIVLEEGITTIETKAFYSTKSAKTLKLVVLPESLIDLGTYAFYDCAGLESINLPPLLTAIQDYTFYGCTSLKTIDIHNRIMRLGSHVFDGAGLEAVVIPSSVTKMGVYDFANCTNLTSATFPAARKKIEDYTFYNCSALTSITMPRLVDTVGVSAFQGCSSLTEINWSERITTLGSSSFRGCAALQNVVIPETVTSIGTYAFADCTTLTGITLPENTTSLANYLFSGCTALQTYELPANVTAIGDGVFSECAALNDITLPEGLQTLGQKVFYNCDALQNIAIPAVTQSFGAQCFYDCDALSSLNLPNSVTSIGIYFCYSADNLASVTLSEGMTAIPEAAFMDCAKLDNVVVPRRVTSIAANAFNVCPSLLRIVLPASVTTMAGNALSYPDRTVIYGRSGSYAQSYADEYGYAFVEYEVNATGVTLSESAISIPRGKTATLVATVSPADYTDDVTWKSTNTGVVTVSDNGVVTAVGVGTATVRMVVGNVSASCKITVIEPVTKITLSKTTLTLDARETAALSATVTPTAATIKTVQWSSSNEAVATVDENGVVTAVGKGTAKITATAEDGTGIFASCTVTVTGNYIIAESIDELQSPHPYTVNCNDIWQYSVPGATQLNLTFSADTAVESGSDYIYIYSADGTLVGKYTGIELAGKTIAVPGGTVRIKLVSDGTYCEYGFAVTSVTTQSEPHTHNYTSVVTAPTCTEQGYTTHTCTVCGDSYRDTYTAALGHAWDNGVVTKQPTETEQGEKTYTCTRCGATRTESIPELGHKHQYTETVTAPTCTEKGYTTHTCACGDSYMDAYVSPLGHAWDSGKVTTQPTETTAGVKTFTCTRCDATRTESIPATGDKPCDGGADCPSGKFVDVNPKEWYHPYVDYAVTHGLFGGTSANTFEPETAMTRAMLVTVLWRYEGEPDAPANTFSDVKSGTWYSNAVSWAAANGVVNGVGNNKFDPEGKITREQMATILFRYAQKEGIDTSKRGNLGDFPDANRVSSYAKDAVQWAVGEKIINGSDGKLLPQGSATRAQVATILVRFIENIVNE